MSHRIDRENLYFYREVYPKYIPKESLIKEVTKLTTNKTQFLVGSLKAVINIRVFCGRKIWVKCFRLNNECMLRIWPEQWTPAGTQPGSVRILHFWWMDLHCCVLSALYHWSNKLKKIRLHIAMYRQFSGRLEANNWQLRSQRKYFSTKLQSGYFLSSTFYLISFISLIVKILILKICNMN